MSHPMSDGQVPTASVSTLTGDVTISTNKSVGVRLTVMMFLEFAVWGSWFATLGLVLATNKLPAIIGTAFSLAAVAAIVSPMLLGAIGDRFLASQKVMGISQLVGGVILLFIPTVIGTGNGAATLVILFVYMIVFMPTLGLANSIAFRHIGENQRLFPYIRVFGTGGWFIAGLIVGWLGLSASSGVFTFAAVLSLVYGVYAFTLPKTPPPAKGVRFSFGDIVGAKAWVLLKHRNFLVLMLCALFTSISLGVYNTFASTFLGVLGVKNVAGVLSIGQLSEVVFILAIPVALRVLGMKWALFSGMVLWGVRFALFMVAADTHNWVAVIAIALQGLCNDFFLILAAMYIDRVSPIELTAQAQSMLILVVSGVGGFIGSFLSGQIYGAAVAPLGESATAASWNPIWWIPIVAAVITAVLWGTLFRFSKKQDIARIETGAVTTA
jgi:nucleoside transporter